MSVNKFLVTKDGETRPITDFGETLYYNTDRNLISQFYHPAFQYRNFSNPSTTKVISGVFDDVGTVLLKTPTEGVENVFKVDVLNGKLQINSNPVGVARKGNFPRWDQQTYVWSPGTKYLLYAEDSTDYPGTHNFYYTKEDGTSKTYVASNKSSLQLLFCGGGGGGGGITHPFAFFAYNGGSGGGAATMLIWIYLKKKLGSAIKIARFCTGAGGKTWHGYTQMSYSDGKMHADSIGINGGGGGKSGDATWVELFINGKTYHADATGGRGGSHGGGSGSGEANPVFWEGSTDNSFQIGTKIDCDKYHIKYVNGVKGASGGARLCSGGSVSYEWTIPTVYNKTLSKSFSGGKGYDGNDPGACAGGGASGLGKGADWNLSNGNSTSPSWPGWGGGGLNDICASLNGNYYFGTHGKDGVLYFYY